MMLPGASAVSIVAGRDQLPPPGFVDTSAWPLPSTTTQKVVDGHEIPVSCLSPLVSMPVLTHEPVVVGLVAARAFPALSTATHRDADGHETAFSAAVPSTVWAVQAPAPPVGLVAV